MDNIICFNETQFSRIFPFYLKIKRDFTVSAYGSSLGHLCTIAQGTNFHPSFELMEPCLGNITFEGICKLAGDIVKVKYGDGQLILIGQVEYLEPTDELVFLVAPEYHCIEEVIRENSELPNLTNVQGQEGLTYILSENDLFGHVNQETFFKIAQDTRAFTRLDINDRKNIHGNILTDTNGNIEWVDQTFKLITGYNSQEVIGWRLENILCTQEVAVFVAELFNEQMSIGRSFSFENVGFTRNRTPLGFSISAHPLFKDDGTIKGWFLTLEDVSWYIKYVADLAESHQLWKIALEEADHGVWVYYRKERKTKFSSLFKKLIGYNEEDEFDLAGWVETVYPEDLHYYSNVLIPSLTPQAPYYNVELRLKNKDGKYRHYKAKGKAVEWDEDGSPSIMVGTLADVNEKVLKDIELKNSSERLLKLINNFNSGVLFEKDDRTLLLVNQKFCELMLLDETPEMMVGIDSAKSLNEGKGIFKYPDEFEKRVEELIAGKKSVVDEVIYMSDGSIYVRDFIPIEGGYMWIYRDVTEKKRYEDRLKSQQEYYQTILDEVPAEIVISSRDQKFQYISKSAVKEEDIREWMIGKTIHEYCVFRNFDAELADLRSGYFNATVASKQISRFIEEHESETGDTVFMLQIYYPILDLAGEVDYVIGYGINITEQVKNERFAEIQEKRIRNLLEIIKDGVFRCSEDGIANLYNDSFLKILELGGYAFTQGDNINLFDLLSKEDLVDVLKKNEILKTTGAPQFGMFQMKAPDGEVKYIDYTFTKAVLMSEDLSLAGRISDVTAIVNRERDLQRIIQQEQALNNSKSQFVRITSHELRTPLAIILANAEILEMVVARHDFSREQVSPEKMLGRIIKEVTIMTEILNQLMTISKIESGNVEFNCIDVDVRDFLADLKAELYDPCTDGRSLELAIEPDVCSVKADKKLLRHAIVNLVSNAFKYSPGKPSPVLSVRNEGESTVFEVQDFGIGVPDTDKQKIFQSFFRASNVGGIQGTGLGLMVLDYAIKKHRGEVFFESELNKGSKFKIVIPKKKQSDESV